MTTSSNDVAAASVSFAVVLIPAEPVYSQVSRASMEISAQYENTNLIDNDRFPAHLSLILAGTTESGLKFLSDTITHYPRKTPNGRLVNIYTGRGGFVGVSVRSLDCRELHQRVLDSMSQLLSKEAVVRPHLKDRWGSTPLSERELLLKYGSRHVGPKFTPHFSVAQTADADLEDVVSIARANIKIPQDAAFSKLQIIDIGHLNEKWSVVTSIDLL